MNDNAAVESDKLSPRALEQRERILAAARCCFVENGFHAASMAQLASKAEMSAGLIYRYFENKNAIVMAIIERQLEQSSVTIDQVNSADDLVDAALRVYDRWKSNSDEGLHVSLFLEIPAEATRNAEIASAVRAADRTIRHRLVRALQRIASRDGQQLTDDDARVRTLLLQALIEGLATRSIRQPDLDRAMLARGLANAIPVIMRS